VRATSWSPEQIARRLVLGFPAMKKALRRAGGASECRPGFAHATSPVIPCGPGESREADLKPVRTSMAAWTCFAGVAIWPSSKPPVQRARRAAALAIQRGLGAEKWPDGLPVRVRSARAPVSQGGDGVTWQRRPRTGASGCATSPTAGRRFHAAVDDHAQALGWEVTETPGRLGLGGRSYGEPQVGCPRQASRTSAPGGMNAMSDLPPNQVPDVDEPSADGATLRTELPADLASARLARSAVRQTLAGWGMDRLSGDAELLASELVANAAEHGDGTPIGLALHRHGEAGGQSGITCEVTDGSPAMQRRTERGPDVERGRGMAIVNALARSSGVCPSRAGKTTWFTLA
jgi:anti-sigma regulatory factor (Ser/Thr protein kinase)